MHPVLPPDPFERTTQAQHAVAVIPARFDSTRFPGKALAEIAGHPMIEHVYRRAAAAKRVRSVVVATDDRRIADAVEAFGGVVQMTAAHHRSGTDRVAEVARDLDCDLVVNVQGDEPLIEPSAIDDAIAPFDQDPSLVMCTLRTLLVAPSDVNDPDVVKVVVDARGDALYFSRSPIPFSRPRQHAAGDARARIFKHLGLYVYRRAFAIEVAGLSPTPLECEESLEQLRVLEHGFRIRTVETSHDSVGVDTPADLERVRRSLTAAALTVSTHNAAT